MQNPSESVNFQQDEGFPVQNAQKKVPSKKTQAMIVPSDASENILFLKIFLVPSLIPYKNLLNIIGPPYLILFYMSIFDQDHSFAHLIDQLFVVRNN